MGDSFLTRGEALALFRAAAYLAAEAGIGQNDLEYFAFHADSTDVEKLAGNDMDLVKSIAQVLGDAAARRGQMRVESRDIGTILDRQEARIKDLEAAIKTILEKATYEDEERDPDEDDMIEALCDIHELALSALHPSSDSGGTVDSKEIK